MDLVVMAAGMGSRFGGLKQIEPIDKNGNFIIDYSVFDAIRAGFDRVVFIIKKANLEDFKNTIGKRLEKFIKVEYVFQEDDLPAEYGISIKRTKPWGTAHAIMCAKDKITGPFAVINADDFYGKNSFLRIADYLNNIKNQNDFAMVAFRVSNTLTENGEVKRGICELQNQNLKAIKENKVKRVQSEIFASPIEQDDYTLINGDQLVSMNLFGFTPIIFNYLENGFVDFLKKNKENLMSCEYYIPTILTKYISENKGGIKVLETDEKWFGLTYKDDFEHVSSGIKYLINSGVYPTKLWE